MPGAVGNLTMVFRADTKEARAQIRAMRAEMAATTQNANAMIGFAKTAFTMIARASITAFAAATISVAASIAAVKDFNKNLVHAGAIANLTNKEVDALGRTITGLSIAFAQNATDMSAGVVELTKAGLGMQEITSVMDDITMAMLANSISFEEAAQIAVFSVKQFAGDKGFGDLPRLFDIIQKVTQETIMDFGDMQEALQYAGSTALLAQIPFETLMAIMGTLSQRAMTMGIASRSVNQMFMSLIDNADEMQKWINELGLGVDVIKDGKLNIDELIQSFSGLQMTMEDLQRSSDIFSVRAMRAWGLLVTGAEEYKKILTEDIPNAPGTLEGVYEKQKESIAFQLSQLRSIFMAPMQSPEFMKELASLLEGLQEPVAELSKLLFEGLWNFLKWTGENSDNILEFFKGIMQFVFDVITPLYNIGKLITLAGEGTMSVLLYLKMIMSLNVPTYLNSAAKSWAVYSRGVANAENQSRLFSMTMKNMVMAMAGVAMSSFFMGQAFGRNMEKMAMTTIGMTSLMAGLNAMIYAPPGTKIATALMVTGATGLFGTGAYLAGTAFHEEMVKPDMSAFENALSNVNYTPSGSTTTTTTSGSGFGGAPATVNYNFYGNAIVDREFDNRIQRGIDSGY